MKTVKKTHLVYLFGLYMGLVSPLPAADKAVQISGKPEIWRSQTLTLTGPASSESAEPNPFLDYQLVVEFTLGDSRYRVPGYYAACGDAADSSCTEGNQWRVHFTPDQAGIWKYRVSFVQGPGAALSGQGVAVKGLHRLKGKLPISKPAKPSYPYSWGRLQYVGERYLRYAGSAKYLFKVGADAPENMLAYEDFDATPNMGNRRKSWAPHAQDFDKSDAQAFTWQDGKGTEILGMLNYLSSQGMNAVSFLTFNVGGDDQNVFPHLLRVPLEKYHKGRAKQWPQSVYHYRFDVSKLDQWQRVLSYAELKGLFLHFKLQETENDSMMDGGDTQKQRKLYLRELIARFSHLLALNWNIGEENNQPSEYHIAMLDYIKKTDPYGHHRVMHTFPQEKTRYVALLGENSELTGASLQSRVAGFDEVYADTVEWLQKSAATGKPWVVTYDEPGSAGGGTHVDSGYPAAKLPSQNKRPDNRVLLRSRVLWPVMLAGGGGVEYYYGYQTGCTDLNCEDHRTRATKWQDGKQAINFFNRVIEPHALQLQSVNTLTSREDDFVLADPGALYVIYLPNIDINTELDLSGKTGKFNIRWYNPVTGGKLKKGSVTTVTGGTVVDLGQPPVDLKQDWALVVSLQ